MALSRRPAPAPAPGTISRLPRPFEGAASPLGARLSDVDALDDPETDREADQRRTAVRDEWQWDPRDRHDPDHHSEVDDELEQDHRGEPRGEHHSERILRPPARDHEPDEERREQAQKNQRADEPELLQVDRRN